MLALLIYPKHQEESFHDPSICPLKGSCDEIDNER